MGACYSVTLKIKGVKDEEKMKAAMRQVIAERDGNGADYSLARHLEEGVGTDTVDDLLRIFLAGWKTNCFQKDETGKGETIYANDFNASYGWCDEMDEMFKAIAPYVEDGTTFVTDIENDHYIDVVEKGKVVALATGGKNSPDNKTCTKQANVKPVDVEWTERELIEIVMEFGRHGESPNGRLRLEIDVEECLVSWTYWDDNDNEQNDEDGDIKVLHGLAVNDKGRLVCKWDGNFAEAYDSLDDDLQMYIHDEVCDWVKVLRGRTFKIETPCFCGFYESSYLNGDTGVDEIAEEVKYWNESEGSEDLTEDDYELDVEAYCTAVAKAHVEVVFDMIGELYPRLVANVVFDSVWSPRFYNYMTDIDYAKVTLCKGWEAIVLDFLVKEKDFVEPRIREDWKNHRHLSDDYGKWVMYFDCMDTSNAGLQVAVVLEYMLLAHDKDIAETIYERVLEKVNVNEFIKRV